MNTIDQERETADVIRRFNDIFIRHDPSALPDLIAEDCVVETIGPAPDGAREAGRAACVELWRRIATRPESYFQVEDTFVVQDRAIILWKYFWGKGENECVRGVNVMRVRDGHIVEARGYSKTG